VDLGLRAGLGFALLQIVYLDLHCLFWIPVGSTLYAWIFFGFGFNGIWNSEEDLRLLFVFFGFVLLCLESLGPKGEC